MYHHPDGGIIDYNELHLLTAYTPVSVDTASPRELTATVMTRDVFIAPQKFPTLLCRPVPRPAVRRNS